MRLLIRKSSSHQLLKKDTDVSDTMYHKRLFIVPPIVALPLCVPSHSIPPLVNITAGDKMDAYPW